jgi:hypothetical protein
MTFDITYGDSITSVLKFNMHIYWKNFNFGSYRFIVNPSLEEIKVISFNPLICVYIYIYVYHKLFKTTVYTGIVSEQ